ncbi:hypothetical protein D3C73_1454490 [compost metagenome]
MRGRQKGGRQIRQDPVALDPILGGLDKTEFRSCFFKSGGYPFRLAFSHYDLPYAGLGQAAKQ